MGLSLVAGTSGKLILGSIAARVAWGLIWGCSLSASGKLRILVALVFFGEARGGMAICAQSSRPCPLVEAM